MVKNILYIAPGVSALSHTFIYREIFELVDRGYHVFTASQKSPEADSTSSEARVLLSTTFHLDSISSFRKAIIFLTQFIQKPTTVLRNIYRAVSCFTWSSPLIPAKLIYHFILASAMVKFARDHQIDHIHCHFATYPSSIGMFLSDLTGIPFSFTTHANDIFVSALALDLKLETCKFAVTISRYNKKVLLDTYGHRYKDIIHVIHCGLKFPYKAIEGKLPNPGYLRILTIARMVPKKGLDILILACGLLKQWGIPFHCTLIGDGPDKQYLTELAHNNNISGDVHFTGAVHQERLDGFFLNADVFVLPCRICENGDRDGIPVSLMEAMACRLPVVSSDISGIPELIDHDINGYLVPEGDFQTLANRLKDLFSNPDLMINFGKKGYDKVLKEFNVSLSVDFLDRLLNSPDRTLV